MQEIKNKRVAQFLIKTIMKTNKNRFENDINEAIEHIKGSTVIFDTELILNILFDWNVINSKSPHPYKNQTKIDEYEDLIYESFKNTSISASYFFNVLEGNDE